LARAFDDDDTSTLDGLARADRDAAGFAIAPPKRDVLSVRARFVAAGGRRMILEPP